MIFPTEGPTNVPDGALGEALSQRRLSLYPSECGELQTDQLQGLRGTLWEEWTTSTKPRQKRALALHAAIHDCCKPTRKRAITPNPQQRYSRNVGELRERGVPNGAAENSTAVGPGSFTAAARDAASHSRRIFTLQLKPKSQTLNKSAHKSLSNVTRESQHIQRLYREFGQRMVRLQAVAAESEISVLAVTADRQAVPLRRAQMRGIRIQVTGRAERQGSNKRPVTFRHSFLRPGSARKIRFHGLRAESGGGNKPAQAFWVSC